MPMNKKHVIAARRNKVAELTLKGFTQSEIALELGYTQSQISRDLKIISGQWKESMLQDISLIKSRELAKLDMIERRLWDAWERSTDKKHKKRVKKIRERESLQEKERELTAIEGIGDPRYVSEILKCIQQRTKLMGLDEPQKLNLNFDQLTDQHLDTLIDNLLNNG